MKNIFTLLIAALILFSCGNDSTSTPAAATSNSAPAQKVATPKTSTGKGKVGLKAKNVTAKSGSEVCIDVTVSNFNEIISMQYSTVWDTKALKLKGPRNMLLRHLTKQNFGQNPKETGVMRLSWYPQDLKEVSLMDGSTIYQLCFDAIGASGTKTEVKFTDKPMVVEIVNVHNKFFGIETQPVVVTIE